MTENTIDAFNTWLVGQDEGTQTLVRERFAKLENTVKATREERDAFKTQLRELASKAEKGSELEVTINQLSDKLVKAERKATLLEQAGSNGCNKPEVAYKLATADNLFQDDGSVDWKKIKEILPEIFTAPNLNSNAGSGTNRKNKNQSDFNSRIRESLRRK